MKREILFKGFSHKYKSWITGIYCLDVNYSNEVYTCIQVVNRSAEGEILNIGRYEVDPKTVCQYTGLKDKNGVKIFEGDVVNCRMPMEEAGLHPCKVEFDEEGEWVFINDRLDVADAFGMVEVFSVTGNIHD